MSNELTEAECEALMSGWWARMPRPLGLIPTVERILDARETALRAQIAKEIRAVDLFESRASGWTPRIMSAPAALEAAAKVAEGGTDE